MNILHLIDGVYSKNVSKVSSGHYVPTFSDSRINEATPEDTYIISQLGNYSCLLDVW